MADDKQIEDQISGEESNIDPNLAQPFWAGLAMRFKRFRSRRAITALLIFFAVSGIALFAFLQLNIGNSFIESQIRGSLDQMGITYQADYFRMPILPLRFEFTNAQFRNKKTGELLFKAKQMQMNMKITDLLSMSLRRNVNVEAASIDGLEIWINKKKDGTTNYSGVELVDGDGRVKLHFEATKVAVTNGLIHFGEKTRKLGIEGSNIVLSVEPINNAPINADKTVKIDLASDKSSFVYGDKHINPIDIILSATGNGKGANISYLNVNSPIGSTVITGDLTSWADLGYSLKVKTNVDITKTAGLFPISTPISGNGEFNGTIDGTGEDYTIKGLVTSDNLFASNVRLKALKVNAAIDGKGSVYNAHGKAVAELLTFEDYVVNFPQLSGTVRGSGSDFRWFGELQAIAARTPWGTISNLMIADADAEYRDSKLKTNLGTLRAGSFDSPGAAIDSLVVSNANIATIDGTTLASIPDARATKVDVKGASLRGVNVSGVKVRNRTGNTNIAANSARVAELETEDARLKNISASNVRIDNRKGNTKAAASKITAASVETRAATVGRIEASDVDFTQTGRLTKIYSNNLKVASIISDAAVLGSLNIGGVRLSIRDGRIEGTSNDFNAGNIDLKKNGELDDVAIRKPVFVLEPSGSYRATMDMSIGGGVLGKIKLGEASASVVASSDSIALNSLNANLLGGKVVGNAEIGTSNRNRSRVDASFTNLSAGQLLALMGGQVYPVEGTANGKADLSFYGNELNHADGTVVADIVANAGNDDEGLIPLTGNLDLKATNGLFAIRSGVLNTPNSSLNATGRFDLNGDDSDMNLLVNSSDASEVETLFRVLDISEDTEAQLDKYNATFAGNFLLQGRVTGNLSNPFITATTSLQSLIVNGNNMGSLSGKMDLTPQLFTFSEGRLVEPDGGVLAFDVNVPRQGKDNMSVNATLDKVDLGSILSALNISSIPESLRSLQADTSGTVNLTGLPNAIDGKADLVAVNGSINGQTFDRIDTKLSFGKSQMTIENFVAKFGNGSLDGKGNYNFADGRFDVRFNSDDVPIERILAFFPANPSMPSVAGVVNGEAIMSGVSSDPSTYDIQFTGVGNDVAINGSGFGDISFEGKTVDQVLNMKMSTRARGRIQLLTGNVNFGSPGMPIHIETTLNKATLDPYIAIVRDPKSNSINITGEATGTITVDGNLTKVGPDGKNMFTADQLSGIAKFTQFDLKIDETPLNATEPVELKFNSQEGTISNAKFAGGGSNLVISGTKAFRDNGVNNLLLDGQINLRILNALSKNVFYSGEADVEMRLTGPNASARLNGLASVNNASVATFVGGERLTFERLKGSVIFTTNQVQIEELNGYLGGGRISATGGAYLENLQLQRYQVEIRGSNVSARLPKDFVSTGDLDIQINGRFANGEMNTLISGTIAAKRSVYEKNIDIADLLNQRKNASLAQSTSGSSLIGVPNLDIRIIGRNALHVRNNLADLSASLDLRVTGDTEYPQISGRVTANSGTLFYRDDRYEVQRGVLTFPPNSTTLLPTINLQAETEKRGYQLFVSLIGPLSDTQGLNITLRSNPALPQADVVSLITTGNLANTANGIPTYAQSGINTAAELLTDQILNKPIQRATDKLFGLNKFQLDPIISGERQNPTARLTVGRQINRNLLVTYSTNLSQDQNQVLALEYLISNRLSFYAQYEQSALTNATRNRNNFSFEIRLRRRF